VVIVNGDTLRLADWTERCVAGRVLKYSGAADLHLASESSGFRDPHCVCSTRRVFQMSIRLSEQLLRYQNNRNLWDLPDIRTTLG